MSTGWNREEPTGEGIQGEGGERGDRRADDEAAPLGTAADSGAASPTPAEGKVSAEQGGGVAPSAVPSAADSELMDGDAAPAASAGAELAAAGESAEIPAADIPAADKVEGKAASPALVAD